MTGKANQGSNVTALVSMTGTAETADQGSDKAALMWITGVADQGSDVAVLVCVTVKITLYCKNTLISCTDCLSFLHISLCVRKGDPVTSKVSSFVYIKTAMIGHC